MKFGPYPPAPKCIRVTIWTSISGGPLTRNHFFMRYTLAMGSIDATTLCNTVGTSWNTRMAPITDPHYALQSVEILDLDSRSGIDVRVPIAHTGTAAGNPLGAAVSMVIGAKTALRYRGGHSRVYIPGISASEEADQNSWSLTGQGAAFTAWTGLISDMGTSPPPGVGALSNVVVRYISSNKADFNPVPNPWAPPYLLAQPLVLGVSSWSVNPQFGSQRRRNQQ